MEPNRDTISQICNETKSNITTNLTFEWSSEFTGFFPIIQDFSITDKVNWTGYDISWNANYTLNDSIVYHVVIFREESEWINCFETVQTVENMHHQRWISNLQTSYLDEFDNDNVSSNNSDDFYDLSPDLQFSINSVAFSPLKSYTNCDITDRPLSYITHSNGTTTIELEDGDPVYDGCWDNPSTCCDYLSSSNKFNLYFWYDDDVWTSSLSLYQVLTENIIEESLCDFYGEIYSENELNPNDFYVDVSFFFNFCLQAASACPDYDTENEEGSLKFIPSDLDEASGYQMYATFRTNPLSRAEKIYNILTNDQYGQRFQDLIVRRAQEEYGRSSFEVFRYEVTESIIF